MPADTLSRLFLLSQATLLESLALALTALLVAAALLPRLAAAARPAALVLRPVAPLPVRLPPRGAAVPYGAPALKSTYRPALVRGVTLAAAGHLVVILAAGLLVRMAPPPAPESTPDPVDRFRIGPEVILPPAGDTGVPGGGGVPIAIPSIHTLFRPVPDARAERHLFEPDPDDLLAGSEASPDGNPFGHGPGSAGDPGGAEGGNRLGALAAIPDDEPPPGDFRPVESPPILVRMPAPEYPPMARLAGVEGRVELLLLVGRDGHVRRVRVQRSIPGLDEAASVAAARAVFRPALWRQKPVAVWVCLPIVFRLDGADGEE